eukprot:jgi/Bigna1/88797/estExt_fgenesh1_pg.C_380093
MFCFLAPFLFFFFFFFFFSSFSSTTLTPRKITPEGVATVVYSEVRVLDSQQRPTDMWVPCVIEREERDGFFQVQVLDPSVQAHSLIHPKNLRSKPMHLIRKAELEELAQWRTSVMTNADSSNLLLPSSSSLTNTLSQQQLPLQQQQKPDQAKVKQQQQQQQQNSISSLTDQFLTTTNDPPDDLNSGGLSAGNLHRFHPRLLRQQRQQQQQQHRRDRLAGDDSTGRVLSDGLLSDIGETSTLTTGGSKDGAKGRMGGGGKEPSSAGLARGRTEDEEGDDDDDDDDNAQHGPADLAREEELDRRIMELVNSGPSALDSPQRMKRSEDDDDDNNVAANGDNDHADNIRKDNQSMRVSVYYVRCRPIGHSYACLFTTGRVTFKSPGWRRTSGSRRGGHNLESMLFENSKKAAAKTQPDLKVTAWGQRDVQAWLRHVQSSFQVIVRKATRDHTRNHRHRHYDSH